MEKTYLLGLFDDDHKLLDGVRAIRAAGYEPEDVLTPYPVHGMEDAMGWKRSRIPQAGFLFGMLGTMTALGGMSWIFTTDWPINFGGKPYFSLPAFIPITFELTVLFSAIGMVITFFASCRLAPGIFKPVLEKRATDDRFVIVFDKEMLVNEEKLRTILNDNGAVEIKDKEVA